jgi:hypothetical protein
MSLNIFEELGTSNDGLPRIIWVTTINDFLCLNAAPDSVFNWASPYFDGGAIKFDTDNFDIIFHITLRNYRRTSFNPESRSFTTISL